VIGIGGGATSFTIEQLGGTGLGPDLNNPGFAQVLADPGQRSVMTSAAFMVQAGVGAEIIPVRRERAGGWYGMALGVRAGYQFAPINTTWQLYDVDVTGGPDGLGNGFFVRFTIGGTGRKAAREGCRCPMMGGMAQGAQCPMHQGQPAGGEHRH
jgi:hypothetical protein